MDEFKYLILSGQLSNAKSEAGKYLVKRFNDTNFLNTSWRKCAFADSLKNIFCQVFNVDRDFLEYWKRKEENPPGFIMNVRQALQFIGDGFRQIQPDVWIETLFRKNEGCSLCLDDGRYLSEVRSVRDVKKGYAVLIYRPSYENWIDHPSENQFRKYIDILKKRGTDGPVNDSNIPFDYFLINDGTLQDLYDKLDNLFIPWFQKTYSAQEQVSVDL